MSGALATFGIAATKMAASYDLAFARVTSLLPQTKKELDSLRTDTLELSRALGVDAVKSMDGLYEAISAGVPKENAISFLGVATKAAIAGLTDTKVAVDGMTSAVNAFKIPFKDTQKVADQMFQAVNIGKFTFEELASSMGVASSIAHVTGVNLNEVLGAASTISKEGVTVSVAMTRIRSALTALNKPSENLKEIFKQLGVTTGQELVAKFGGLQGALEAIRNQADASGISLSQIFGRVEAVLGTLALTGEKAQSARDDLASVTETTNAMGQAFAKIDATPARNWSRLIAEFKIGLIDAANSTLPVVDGMIDGLRGLIATFNGMPQVVKSAGVEFGTLIGIMGLGIATIIKFASVFTAMKSAMFVTMESVAARGGIAWMQFGSMAATGLGAAVIWLGIATAAVVALDIVLKKFTGRGVLDRIFGDGGREKKLKSDLDEIMAKLSAIDELYPAGSQANANRKDEFLQSKINQLNETISKTAELRARLTELQRGGKAQTYEAVNVQGDYKKNRAEAEDLGKALVKAYEEGNVSQAVFLKGMEQVHGFLLMNGKEGADAWKKIADTDAGQRYIQLSKEMAAMDNDGIMSRGKYAAANKELGDSFRYVADEADVMGDKLSDTIDGMAEGARTIGKVTDAIKGLVDATRSLNPEYQKNAALIALNELQLAKFTNGIRDAAGNIRPMTEAEQRQADAIKGTIESLENKNDVLDKSGQAVVALTGAIAASLSPLEKSNLLTTASATKFQAWVAELVKNKGASDQVINALQLMGAAFDNFAKNPTQAMAAIVELRKTLGADTPEWAAVAKNFDDAFWTQLVGGIGDSQMQAQLIAALEVSLNIDLTGVGEATGNSYLIGINRAFARGFQMGHGDEETSEWVEGGLINPLKNSITAAAPKFATVANQASNAWLDALHKEGGKDKDKEKTAADGFVSGFEDALRQSILERQFGDLGGTLVDNIVVAIRDNTEQAGTAAANAAVKIIDKLQEIRPGPAAEAWGTELAVAVRRAIEEKTPEAVQAVMDMLNKINSVIRNHDIAIAKVNILGNAITTALKTKYETEKKAAVDAADARIKAANDTYDAETKAINKSHDAAMKAFDSSRQAASDSFDAQRKAAEKSYAAQTRALEDAHKAEIKAIEEETDTAVEAINDKIKAVQKYIDLEQKANDLLDHQDRTDKLQNDYGRAKSNAERKRIQKEMDKETRTFQQKLHKDEVDDVIEGLRAEIEAIRKAADDRKDILNEMYEAQKQAMEDAHQAQMEMLDAQREASERAAQAQREAMEESFKRQEEARQAAFDKKIKEMEEEKKKTEEHYDALLGEASIFAEALKMLQEGNMDDILALLAKYNPDWQDAGQSLGEALIDGLRSKKQEVEDFIAEILAIAKDELGSLDLLSLAGGGSGSGLSSSRESITRRPSSSGTGTHIGAYAGGTPYSREGLAFVGEGGIELANLKAGSSVSSHTQTKELIKASVMEALGQQGSGGDDRPIEVTVYIGQEKFDSMVVKSMTRKSRNTY